MKKTRLCIYHERGRCSKGSSCTFAHGEHELHKSSPKRPLGGDRMACWSFKQDGTCKFGERCNYSHDVEGAARSSSGVEAGARSGPIGGQGRSNNIHGFLQPDRAEPFRHQVQVCRFIEACGSSDDPAGLIPLLGAKTGLERLSQVCSWPEGFSIDAGCGRGYTSQVRAISFQRVIVPLIKVVTQESFRQSTLSQFVNPIYSTMYQSQGFLGKVLECLEQLTDTGSVKDNDFAMQDQGSWEPQDYTEVFEPVALFLHQILQRFVDSQYDKAVVMAVRKTQELLQVWAHLDSRKNAESARTTLALSLRILEAASAKQKASDARKQAAERRGLLASPLDHPSTAFLSAVTDGPGELSESGQARHDNDKVQVDEISIAPTSEEALCTTAPYLPPNVPNAQRHLEGLQGHLDTHFRLLREDFMHSVRAGVSQFLARGGGRGAPVRDGRFLCGESSSIFVFSNIKVVGMSADEHNGVSYVIEFDDLPSIRNKSLQQRQAFWDKTKRLQHGSLVCFWWDSQAGADLVFATVSQRDVDALAHEEASPRVQVSLMGGGTSFSKTLATNRPGAVLLQVSDSFFSYHPILKAIQAHVSNDMTSSLSQYFVGRAVAAPREHVVALSYTADDGGLPVHVARNTKVTLLGEDVLPGRVLVRQKEGDDQPVISVPKALVCRQGEVLPPAYLSAECTFDLSHLLAEDSSEAKDLERVVLMDQVEREKAWEVLQLCSTLDDAQLRAFKAALTQEICIIQGPPGTGKSYIGIQIVQTLVKNKDRRSSLPKFRELFERTEPATNRGADIGPILVLCYTNHQLDQHLEGLLDVGVTNIVRVGSRSKSTRLQSRSIRELGKGERHRGDGPMLYECRNKLNVKRDRIKEVHERLCKPDLGEYDVRDFLENNAPALWFSLSGETSDGFKKQSKGAFQDWLYGKCGIPGCQVHLSSSKQQNKRQDDPTLQTNNRFDSLWSGGGGGSAHSQRVQQDDTHNQAFVTIQDYELVPAGSLVYLSGSGSQQTLVRVSFDGKRLPFPRALLMPVHQTNRSVEMILRTEDAWLLSHFERRRLHDFVREQVQQDWIEELKTLTASYTCHMSALQNVKDHIDLRIMRENDVIGMTTTGASTLRGLVKSLGPRVIIVEEAAEVLEAHVLAALSSATQHLIMIGDHQQLRPKAQVYDLTVESGKGKNLDLSMFERLVRQGTVQHTVLSTQRRMLPAISELVRSTIYPELRDHPNVSEYPPVKGMAKPLFFFDHDHPEGGDDDEESKSKTNFFEVDMVVGLAAYMLRQGYKPGEVTIITPYVGQLLKLREALSKHTQVYLGSRDREEVGKYAEDGHNDQGQDDELEVKHGAIRERIRLATIDNFQGEESEVIIMSLVRNHPKGKIGFLKTTNRINVLLSRAKHGMYIFGHKDSLTRDLSSKMWPTVLEILNRTDALGSSLPLRCPNHPDTVTEICQPEEFARLVGDGGCSLECGFRLECGHQCPRRCHPDDKEHKAVKCQKPCQRIRDLSKCPHQHPCPLLCGETCGPCKVNMGTVQLPCGHDHKYTQCHESINPSKIDCRVKIDITMPRCEHKINVECCNKNRTLSDPSLCTSKCGEVLSCGHACEVQCGKRAGGASFFGMDSSSSETQEEGCERHGKCTASCGKLLLCGHACEAKCHASGQTECPPCKKKCSNRCEHTTCAKSCVEVCSPCVEACAWECRHQARCTVPCGAPCTRLPCDERCQKVLSCGHQCPSICGETCPPPKMACKQCAGAHVLEQRVDLIMMTTLGEYDFESGPLVYLKCGHIFTMESLDALCELDICYSRSSDGRWSRPSVRPDSLQAVKSCPDCRQPICGVRRYGRAMNRAMLDQMTRKFIIWGQSSISKLKKDMNQAVKDFALKDDKELLLACAELSQTLQSIVESSQKLANTRQPLRSIHDACVAEKERKGAPKECDRDVSEPDSTIFFEAGLLTAEARAYALGCYFSSLQKRGLGGGVTDKLLEKSGFSEAFQDAVELVGAAEREGRSLTARKGRMAAARLAVSRARGVLECALELERGEGGGLVSAEVMESLLGTECGLAFCKTVYGSALEGDEEALSLRVSCAEVLGLIIALRVSQGQSQAQSHTAFHDAVRICADVAGASGEGDAAKRAHRVQISLMARRAASLRAAPELQEERSRLLRGARELLVLPLPWGEEDGAEKEIRGAESADFYQELSLAEKRSVFSAMGFTSNNRTTGMGNHWYTCPNGHIYTIGDCGGAMTSSTCPECGAAIGGSSHAVTSGNSVASAFLDDVAAT